MRTLFFVLLLTGCTRTPQYVEPERCMEYDCSDQLRLDGGFDDAGYMR